jgi:hypothetical protein
LLNSNKKGTTALQHRKSTYPLQLLAEKVDVLVVECIANFSGEISKC